MSYLDDEDAPNEQERGSSRRSKGLRGGSGEPSAEASGGRSTGTFTGFGGGRFGKGGGASKGGAGGGGNAKATVVKARYTRAGNVQTIRASARYYTTRENEQGEKLEREAFSKEHDGLSREELNNHINQADREHQYHYRMVVSPGTDRGAEGVDLKDYTREVMSEIERQQRGQVSWVAVEHSGDTAHTQRAHVHVIASTDRTLNREDLAQLREHATRSWQEAKERAQTLERDPTMGRDLKELSQLREQQIKEREGVQRESPERTTQQPERAPERDVSREERAPTSPPSREHEDVQQREWGRSGGYER